MVLSFCELHFQDKRKKFPGLAIPNDVKPRTFDAPEDADDVKVAQDALAELEALAPTGEVKMEPKRYVHELKYENVYFQCSISCPRLLQ